jgi:hypothetical protein
LKEDTLPIKRKKPKEQKPKRKRKPAAPQTPPATETKPPAETTAASDPGVEVEKNGIDDGDSYEETHSSGYHETEDDDG